MKKKQSLYLMFPYKKAFEKLCKNALNMHYYYCNLRVIGWYFFPQIPGLVL